MLQMNEDVRSFVDASQNLFNAARPIALALAPNTAQVWPGGAVFTSIQAAIDSISNAGPQLQYQVAVGPGTFKENIVLKDYVFVIGAGQTSTFITAQGQGQANNITGVVNSASNSGISELTITATGGGWGTWPVGIKIMGISKFHISGVTIVSGDNGTEGNNIRGISNNTGGAGGQVILSQSIIQATGGSNSTAEGIELFGIYGPLSLFVNLTTINVTAPYAYGVTLAINSSAIIDDSKIIAATVALNNSDGTSPIVANQCTIDGPVSPGVTVNP